MEGMTVRQENSTSVMSNVEVGENKGYTPTNNKKEFDKPSPISPSIRNFNNNALQTSFRIRMVNNDQSIQKA